MSEKIPADMYFDLLCRLSVFYTNHTESKEAYYA